MKALFYDTETSGLPLWNEPSEDPRQPHLVQLAACLVDLDSRKTLASMDVIIQPAGWTIPEEIAAIHGITTEQALDVGVAEATAVEMLIDLWTLRTRIAHNESFDSRIIRIALSRYRELGLCNPDDWSDGKTRCTQALATPILKLPPTRRMLAAGRNHYKSANLAEAYKHFTGHDIENAHSAMADVQACMTVYFAIQDLQGARS